ncbi:DUF397 domain-containing protein [Streptomyces albireticuli]|uniref:DUF397 domain-containing protein n=1 Tax=Streptomyces albireticuli TaxID=1940 RepID=UPI0036811FC0
MTAPIWQRSSYCESGSTCVHIAATPAGEILLRESESPETTLTTTPDRLRPFISHIKADRLARGQT